MTVVRGQRECSQTRQLLDAYVSNELSVETNLEVMRHLGECPECLADLNVREQLRASLRRAVEGTRVPAGLELRIVRGLRGERKRDWRLLTSIAAGLVMAAGLGLAYWNQGRERILRVGYANHLACTLAGHYPDTIPAPEAMEQRMEGYAPVLTAVRSGLGEGYVVRQAHQCGSDRRFAHVIVQKGSVLLSVSVTRKAAGEEFRLGRWTGGTQSAVIEGLEVAGMDAGAHWVFVTSNQERTGNSAVAERLNGGIRGALRF